MYFKDIIGELELFSHCSTQQIDFIVSRLRKVEYPAGRIILSEGSAGDYLYILISGEVSVVKRLPDILQCDDVEIGFFEPYQFFGEMSLLNDCPRPTTCIAKNDCELLLLDREDFRQVCAENQQVLLTAVKTNCQRIVFGNQLYIDTLHEIIKRNRLIDIGTATSKIVHDIQTPTSIIILTAELIAQLHSQTAEHTRKIIKQANTLNEYIREILDFARGEKSLLNIDDCDLNLFFDEVKDIVDPISQIKNITVTIDNDVPRTIPIDRNKIKRTITNITKNSIEAIPENSKINITSRLVENKWYLTLRDNGNGIPPEIVENMFEPFYTKGKEHGTGLGLAICKKIVEDHKGTIEIANHHEGGVIVEIVIPV